MTEHHRVPLLGRGEGEMKNYQSYSITAITKLLPSHADEQLSMFRRHTVLDVGPADEGVF